MPRAQGGPNPQHLFVTLFGDYWWARAEHLPSAGLVALAGEFGISSASARAALSRLRRRQLLSASKIGRHTYYGLAPTTRQTIVEGGSRILSFGMDDDPAEWDGTWLVVAFSIPEDQRDVRHTLRTRLRWLGFACLYDGVWVSAGGSAGGDASAAEAKAVVRECGIRDASIFRATSLDSVGGDTGRHPLSAWDLDQLRTAYQEFIDRFEPLYQRILDGDIRSSEALVERTAVMDVWRSFPGLDPGLPSQVLPAGWPRHRAREVFASVYDALGPLAQVRFQHILSQHAPGLAPLVDHHLTTSGPMVGIGVSRP
ncbi:PaaX family transcriptional regulator [Cryptosporangium phraense]|uniref:PaaX family transcriptional regulator n=1 Tax=Cryptosporangium phraense TaxID=2593070 RepID=A0A545AIS0_9ACTN|nr:PaaX family transcriptional regulator [Cryptosporangium phraense]